jgi:hypothetical protein
MLILLYEVQSVLSAARGINKDNESLPEGCGLIFVNHTQCHFCQLTPLVTRPKPWRQLWWPLWQLCPSFEKSCFVPSFPNLDLIPSLGHCHNPHPVSFRQPALHTVFQKCCFHHVTRLFKVLSKFLLAQEQV